jgi:purine nucleoside permease
MKTYWVGFIDDKIADGVPVQVWCPYAKKYLTRQHETGALLFVLRKDARDYYIDVRKVRIEEVK